MLQPVPHRAICYKRGRPIINNYGWLRRITGIYLNTPVYRRAADLPREFEAQEQVFVDAFGILTRAAIDGAFSGASTGLIADGKLIALRGIGRFTYEVGAPEVTPDSIFDLASFSNLWAPRWPCCSTSGGHLDLDIPVARIIPEFAKGDARRRDVTRSHIAAAHFGTAGRTCEPKVCSLFALLPFTEAGFNLLSDGGQHLLGGRCVAS